MTTKDPVVAARLARNREIALKAGRKLARCKPGEEVVISGISGVFPDSDNVKHFGENLLAKKDLISDDDRRWKLEHPEIPQRTGKLNEVNKFDAAFFGVHYKQAQTMDPMSRILLEKAYEAVVDAGYNPKQLRGTKTGVFVGACFSESEKTWFYEKIQIDGFGITGCSRAMLANRISYWLGINGPSYTVDSACSSSLYALEHAYKAIRDGVCDAAIVGGCNLCLHPYVSLQFARLGVLSADGKCKSFDESANGYCRSETVAVAFLQKMKDSRRVYARVVHAKTNCDGYKEQGITYPSGLMQKRLLEEFYEECEVKPNTLNFVEAHGTGTKVGDPEEVNALEQVFCPGRTTPLKIGSVKSNIGHSEPGSGLCSVTKVVLAFELGMIPPNINLKTLRSDIEAFHTGKITVVTEPTPWEGGLAGVNSFGFGGANCHVLLSSNPKNKVDNGTPLDDLPRLVCTSGRTEEAVDVILTDLENRTLDAEFVRLLHEVHSEDIPGHIYRGYTILKKESQPEPVRHIEYFPGERRPIWFVFAGMGSQWPGMGKDLMKIPVFAESVQKSHQTLKPKGVDLIRIITNNDPKTFDNILNSFVGIAAIQIALVDLLRAIGLKPDGIIGHSVGELGCAYADECFTAEQMILAAYYRGLASLETEFIHGSMASIGVGYDTARHLVPSDIDIACHNGPESCTVSGPSESVKKFVTSLQEKGIFAREVKVSNIAYHSRYIADAAPKLMSYLRKIIPEPKLRSSKWISSSNLEADWNKEKAKYSSAEYHTNNLLSSVYFEEASHNVPANAIAIEIAPHGLLQAILKRSLKKDVINIPLTLRNHPDNSEFLLAALGKIYEAGGNFNLANLYPAVEFPVSRGTPMIAPLVRWEHSEDWYVTSYQMQEKIKSGERSVVISLKDDELEYLSGHVVDGRNLYPATGYLMLAWETISLMRGELYSEVPVVFENVRFNRATNIPKEGNIDFTIMVQKGSGNFEVVEGGAAIVTGRIYVPEDVNKECINMPPLEDTPDNTEKLPLTNKDVYKELRLRGYNYKGLFRGVTYANNEGNVGRIAWVNNFVAFMDNMLQMQILQEDTRGLFVPTSIQKMVINTKKHFSILHTLDEEKPEFPVYVYKEIDLISCGGIEVRNLRASAITRKKPLGEPVLEKFQFVPHINLQPTDFKDIIRISTHLALENAPMIKVKTVELIDSFAKTEGPLVSKILVNVLGDLPLIQADIVVLANNEHALVTEEELTGLTVEDKKLPADQSCLMVIASQLLNRKDILQTALTSLKDGGFILTRENTEEKIPFNTLGLDVCLDYTFNDERILLVRKTVEVNLDPVVIKIGGNTFSWVPEVQKALTSLNSGKNQKLVVYAEKEKLNGILGFFNCIRKEPYGEQVRCFFIMDETAPNFSLQHPLYKSQFAKDLSLNVYKNGTWGTYRHLLLENVDNVKVPHAYVNTLVRGDLTTLRWIEGPLDPTVHKPKGKYSMLVHVYYAPLNFRDIMLATGKLASEVIIKSRIDQECVQGFEYAGKAEDGQRYMGMIVAKTMATVIESDLRLQWKVPDAWSLEEAATVPVVYGTVLYALLICGHMKKGESILIHAGSGGVGQAAINICLFYNCEIFTTVGTPEKREFIRKTFPQIPESHIGNSRDTSFEQMVMRETNGKGVDMVLNSLAEEKLQASVRCLGKGGRFMEIGKFDLAKNNTLGMEHFLKEISFHGVMLDNLFYAKTKWKLELRDCLQKGIDEGAVKPLVRTVFAADEVEAAFRYMAAGKHIGKVLLKIRDEEPDLRAKPQILRFDAVPRYLCSESESYILCGGLGGFGLELADWLVLRGARNLVLTSRKGISTGYQAMRVRIWRSYGANVIISTEDITKEEGVKNVIDTANALGPVSAIFNLAVVLQDAVFENQTEETFVASAGPKALATYYFDQLSRKLCPRLQQFVIFSSVSCGRGNAGQTNYGMSNSVMERICEARKAENLPALAIEWGAIGEVGLVADMAEDNLEVVIGGTLQQRISSCLEVMDYFIKQPNPIVASMVVAEKRSGSSGSGTIVDTVANILGLRDLKTVSLHSTLAELGMDSMMGVEIKQTLEREFEVFLTPQDIRGLTFAKLYEIAAAAESEDKTEASGAAKKPTDSTQPSELGMHYFMRLVSDETKAAKPIVRIPSLADDGSTQEVSTRTNPTVFVIPGVEGIANVMEPLGVNLNLQVLCLQYSYEDPPETIQGIAKSLMVHITSRLPPNQEFHIIGYSFGGMVALEVVRLLEEEGRVGRLWLIDSSPEFLKTITKLSFISTTDQIDNEVQVKLILRFLDLIWPEASSEIADQLYQLPDWNSRLDLVIGLTPPEIKHSKRYQRALMTAGYLRIKAVLDYVGLPENCLKASTTLIRPTEISLQMADDYSLSQFFQTPVKVHFVEGNHFTILENKKTSDVITEGTVYHERLMFKNNLNEGKMTPLVANSKQ
ncbi:fatty acid synthase isoform X2 [Planococcus citri]|uniref:fatty acid synthase isoform X2 n=1 Tax=Planococcus citri TaxID=170843 RepID=UPI0031F84352